MSPASITFGRAADMKPTCVAIHGTPEGDKGASREVRFTAAAPPCQSSTAASAPWAWTASVITAWARISASSQSEAKGKGLSSDEGWTEHAPVETTPQPPSALVARKAARTCGLALVMPEAWGT